MFESIRDLFRKTCRDCEYYSWYRTEDRLLPDKTVIKGEVVCETCEKMDSRLHDLKPCGMFRPRSRTHNSMHAFLVHMQGHSKLPQPPNGGSSIQRPK